MDTHDSWLRKLESMHPYQLVVYLAMISSGLVFLFLTLAFISSFWGQNSLHGHRLPVAFWLSTFTLLFASIFVRRLTYHQGDADPGVFEKVLWSVLLMGILFAMLQFWGWRDLAHQGIYFDGIPSGSYLYLLSGIHVVHLSGALLFLVMLIREVRQTFSDPIKDLVFARNPYVGMKVKLFVRYWYFMDAIWLLLFGLFLLSF